MPYKDKEKQKACWARYQKSDKSKRVRSEWTKKNRARLSDQQRARKAADPEKYRAYFRNWHIKRAYGITTEQFNVMLAAQGGVCAICGRLPNGTSHVEQTLVIDHNHDTGKVRGLLCNNCNSGMGILGDSEEHLLAALAYLKKYAAKED